ncbi:hypothetical protein E2562_035672 [Oryza meyeriana var. granulata]|uniref:Uncharacterized protein n=1 Tax=Oryza meyeriana var. granulata TaxID=110450 RepID=A0A6G1E9E2_9ORYZ|nr:hypothetical protein E2562_035672 [Oryza meyeriana var. granulata]
MTATNTAEIMRLRAPAWARRGEDNVISLADVRYGGPPCHATVAVMRTISGQLASPQLFPAGGSGESADEQANIVHIQHALLSLPAKYNQGRLSSSGKLGRPQSYARMCFDRECNSQKHPEKQKK